MTSPMDSPEARSARLVIDLLDARSVRAVRRAGDRWNDLSLGEQVNVLSHALGGLVRITQELRDQVPGANRALQASRDELLLDLAALDLEVSSHGN